MPLAGALAVIERADDAERVEHPGTDVDVVDRARSLGRAVFIGVVRHDAGRGVGDNVEALALLVRADFAERGARDEHQLGVDRRQRLVVDAEFLGHVRHVVLDHDVDLRDQLVDDLAALWPPQVDRKALFAAVVCQRHARVAAVALLAAQASLLGAVGRLDLDHARTHVREQRAAVRPGDVFGNVEDGNASQKWVHGVVSSLIEVGAESTRRRRASATLVVGFSRLQRYDPARARD